MTVEQYQTGTEAAEPTHGGDRDDAGDSGEWNRATAQHLSGGPMSVVDSSWSEPVAVPGPRTRRRLDRDSSWARGTDPDADEGARTPVPFAIEDLARNTHRCATVELDVGDIETALEIEPSRTRSRREPTWEVVPLPPPIPGHRYHAAPVARPWLARLTPRPSRRQRIASWTGLVGGVAMVAIWALLSRSPSPGGYAAQTRPPQLRATTTPAPSAAPVPTAAPRAAEPNTIPVASAAPTSPIRSAKPMPKTLASRTPAKAVAAVHPATTKPGAAAKKPTSAGIKPDARARGTALSATAARKPTTTAMSDAAAKKPTSAATSATRAKKPTSTAMPAATATKSAGTTTKHAGRAAMPAAVTSVAIRPLP